jgi:uncharacterized protein YcbK (DUF882 family)
MRIEDGYYIWNKGDREKLSDNFSTTEFACQCSYKSCVDQKLSIALIDKLQAAREQLGTPLQVTSGYRCTQHQTDLTQNPNIETVKLSQHELGNAADVKPSAQLNKALWVLGKHFDSIGIAGTWLHVDTRPGHRRWRYR